MVDPQDWGADSQSDRRSNASFARQSLDLKRLMKRKNQKKMTEEELEDAVNSA